MTIVCSKPSKSVIRIFVKPNLRYKLHSNPHLSVFDKILKEMAIFNKKLFELTHLILKLNRSALVSQCKYLKNRKGTEYHFKSP